MDKDVILEIERLLAEYYEPHEAQQWWALTRERFDGMSASDMIEAGRSGEVLASLQQLDDAVYL